MNNKTIAKWFSMFLLLMVASVNNAFAQKLAVDDFTVGPEETKAITIDLVQGEVAVKGFQAEIALTGGLTLADDPEAVAGTMTKGTKPATPSVSYNAENGKLLVISYDGLTFNADAKEVVTLNVSAPAEFEAGRFTLKNIKMVLADNSQVSADDVTVDVSNGILPVAKFATGKYYLQNLYSEKFWGAGNSWGTQASLVEHPEYVTLIANEDGTYKMETQVSNGGESYYFGGDYMDGSPMNLTITTAEELGENALTGEKVYAYNIKSPEGKCFGDDGVEGNTVLGKDVFDGSYNAMWIIASEDDMLNSLKLATEDEPVDATFLILDPNFGRNNRNKEAWTGDSFSIGGENSNMNAEKWGGNSQTFDINQTVDVPNGKYKISWNGYYRYNNTTDNTTDVAIAAHADGTEVINSFVYINGTDYALTSIADDAASEALGGSLPFSQTDATAAFEKGLYAQEAEVLVTDGKLTIGIKKTDHPGCDWTVWDNFVIYYYGSGSSNEDMEPVVPAGYTKMVSNGNLAGDKVVNFVSKEAPSADIVGARIVEGAGKNGGRGIEVKSADNPAQGWDTQFWIVLDDALATGTALHVEFDYKADKAASASTQAHGDPGNYQHWAAIGNVNFTTEWQHFSADIEVSGEMAGANGLKSIAFNLADEKTATVYNFDNFGVWAKLPKPVDEWTNLIVNSDMEGDDVSCFYVTEQGVGGPFLAPLTAGVGKDGGKAVKVQSADGPTNSWDTQFFIRVPYQLPAGTKYKISFDYKADVAAKATTQAHGEPGAYIHWAGIGDVNFTDAWQHFELTTSVSSDQSKADNPMQTIAFNLAELASANVYVFDNVMFEVPSDVVATLTKKDSPNQNPYPQKETIKVGEAEIPVIATVNVNHEMLQKVAYAGDTDKFSVDAIVANFGEGTTMADLTTYWVNPDGTTVAPTYGGGTIDGWRNAEGFVAEWGASANGMCVKIQDPASGIIDYLGAHDGNFVEGDNYVAKFAFVGGDKAVVLAVNITFVSTPPYKPEIVKTIEIAHKEVAETAYSTVEAAPTFDVAEVCTALGISDISEAKAYIVNVTTGNFVANTTDGWRDANGDACSWGDATNGFCLKLNDPASGEFDYTGAHDANFKVGDTYVAQWGLVANEKAVLLKVTVTFDTEEAVGINGIAADMKSATIYDLTGRRVKNITKGNLYIINGKKVLVK